MAAVSGVGLISVWNRVRWNRVTDENFIDPNPALDWTIASTSDDTEEQNEYDDIGRERRAEKRHGGQQSTDDGRYSTAEAVDEYASHRTCTIKRIEYSRECQQTTKAANSLNTRVKYANRDY